MKLNLKRYFKKGDNIFVISLLFLTIVYGFFGKSQQPWKNWEDAAVFFTFIYTVVLYLNGFFIKKHFKDLPIEKIGLIVIGIFLLGLSTYYLIENLLHELNPVKYEENGRTWIMFCLFVSATVLCFIDYVLGNGNQDYSSGYNKIFYYSDLPIAFAFFILFLYSIKMEESQELNPFFAGSVAFQMMLSNLLWSFADDKQFDN